MTGKRIQRGLRAGGAHERWYNLKSDLNHIPDPPLHPGTTIPVFKEEMEVILPRAVAEFEYLEERWLDIPEDLRKLYGKFRPTKLFYADRLRKYLETPAHIFYKAETRPGGGLLLSALAQAYYSQKEGAKRIVAGTASGLWGNAIATASAILGMESKIYVARDSLKKRPYIPLKIAALGSSSDGSPSAFTEPGRKKLASDPDTPGGLALAMSEAIWDAARRSDTRYAPLFWADLNFIYSSPVGEETLNQLEEFELIPDIVIGPACSESSFPGFIAPFLRKIVRGENHVKLLAAEPVSFPVLSKGIYSYDFADQIGLSPLFRMFTFGHSITPPEIYAGGFRQHSASPMMSLLKRNGVIETMSYREKDALEAALLFARTEGILPKAETAYAVKAAVDMAIKARDMGEELTILLLIEGDSTSDLNIYDIYIKGALEEHTFPSEAVYEALKDLPELRAKTTTPV